MEVIGKTRNTFRSYAIKRLYDDAFYTGKYYHFSTTTTPKLYKQISHAKNAVRRQAQYLFEDMHGPFQHRYGQPGYIRWYQLTDEEVWYFVNSYFEIVEIDNVVGHLVVTPRQPLTIERIYDRFKLIDDRVSMTIDVNQSDYANVAFTLPSNDVLRVVWEKAHGFSFQSFLTKENVPYIVALTQLCEGEPT